MGGIRLASRRENISAITRQIENHRRFIGGSFLPTKRSREVSFSFSFFFSKESLNPVSGGEDEKFG